MYNNPYAMGQQQMQSPPQGLKGRPVSSMEEARVANIEFDGSLYIFPDIVNKRIYTKQIKMDGTASFNMYVQAEIPSLDPVTMNNNFITREEFDAAVAQLKESLNKIPDTRTVAAPALNF